MLPPPLCQCLQRPGYPFTRAARSKGQPPGVNDVLKGTTMGDLDAAFCKDRRFKSTDQWLGLTEVWLVRHWIPQHTHTHSHNDRQVLYYYSIYPEDRVVPVKGQHHWACLIVNIPLYLCWPIGQQQLSLQGCHSGRIVCNMKSAAWFIYFYDLYCSQPPGGDRGDMSCRPYLSCRGAATERYCHASFVSGIFSLVCVPTTANTLSDRFSGYCV